MNKFKEFEHKGYKVSIVQDEDSESPDNWGNEDCFLVYDHRDFTVEVKGFDPEDIFNHFNESGHHKLFQGYFVFPVYAYIHSEVSLSLGRSSYPFTDPWDTSFKGFALVKRQKGWTYTREKAHKVAQSIVDEWNTYLSGEVCGYIIEDSKGKEIESVWGFYGIDYCEKEARELCEYSNKQSIKDHFERVKTWIRNRVPLYKRFAIAEYWEDDGLPCMA